MVKQKELDAKYRLKKIRDHLKCTEKKLESDIDFEKQSKSRYKLHLALSKEYEALVCEVHKLADQSIARLEAKYNKPHYTDMECIRRNQPNSYGSIKRYTPWNVKDSVQPQPKVAEQDASTLANYQSKKQHLAELRAHLAALIVFKTKKYDERYAAKYTTKDKYDFEHHRNTGMAQHLCDFVKEVEEKK